MEAMAGMAGNQVLNWFDFDSEVKTAEMKDVSIARAWYSAESIVDVYWIESQDPLAPPDL